MLELLIHSQHPQSHAAQQDTWLASQTGSIPRNRHQHHLAWRFLGLGHGGRFEGPDNFSCGLFAWNALSHFLLPDQHPLIPSKGAAEGRLNVLLPETQHQEPHILGNVFRYSIPPLLGPDELSEDSDLEIQSTYINTDVDETSEDPYSTDDESSSSSHSSNGNLQSCAIRHIRLSSSSSSSNGNPQSTINQIR